MGKIQNTFWGYIFQKTIILKYVYLYSRVHSLTHSLNHSFTIIN